MPGLTKVWHAHLQVIGMWQVSYKWLENHWRSLRHKILPTDQLLRPTTWATDQTIWATNHLSDWTPEWPTVDSSFPPPLISLVGGIIRMVLKVVNYCTYNKFLVPCTAGSWTHTTRSLDRQHLLTFSILDGITRLYATLSERYTIIHLSIRVTLEIHNSLWS